MYVFGKLKASTLFVCEEGLNGVVGVIVFVVAVGIVVGGVGRKLGGGGEVHGSPPGAPVAVP